MFGLDLNVATAMKKAMMQGLRNFLAEASEMGCQVASTEIKVRC